MAESSRDRGAVDFEQILNFRQFGGYVNVEGRTVKRDLVYRSGEIGNASEADLERLAAMAIKTIVDLRSPGETERSPDPVLPGCRNVALPIHDEASDVDEVREAIEAGDWDKIGAHRMIRGYTAFTRRYRKNYAELLRLMADHANLPLVFHCTAGKDRVGVGSLITLLALGVGEDEIIDDFAASDEFRRAFNDGAKAFVRKQEADRHGIPEAEVDLEAFEAMLHARTEYIAAAIGAINEDFPDTESYLRDGLGLSSQELGSIRNNLLA